RRGKSPQSGTFSTRLTPRPSPAASPPPPPTVFPRGPPAPPGGRRPLRARSRAAPAAPAALAALAAPPVPPVPSGLSRSRAHPPPIRDDRDPEEDQKCRQHQDEHPAHHGPHHLGHRLVAARPSGPGEPLVHEAQRIGPEVVHEHQHEDQRRNQRPE